MSEINVKLVLSFKVDPSKQRDDGTYEWPDDVIKTLTVGDEAEHGKSSFDGLLDDDQFKQLLAMMDKVRVEQAKKSTRTTMKPKPKAGTKKSPASNSATSAANKAAATTQQTPAKQALAGTQMAFA